MNRCTSDDVHGRPQKKMQEGGGGGMGGQCYPEFHV